MSGALVRGRAPLGLLLACLALCAAPHGDARADARLDLLMADLEAKLRANEAHAPTAAAQPADAPGTTTRGLALVSPLRIGETLHGWRLRDVRAASDGPLLLFVAPGDASPLEIVLAPPERAGGCFFRTPKHCVYYRGGAPKAASATGSAPPALGVVCEPGAPEAPAVLRAAFWRNLWRALLAALALWLPALAFLATRRRTAEPAPTSRLLIFGSLGVTLAGLALRLALSPRAFLHEFYRGSDTITQYLFADAGGPFGFGPQGETGPALYGLVDAFAGAGEGSVFAVNLALSTLTVPAVIALDLALFGRPIRALLSGLVMAALPMHLRFSASEELQIPATLFLAVAFVFIVRWARRGEGLSGLVAVVALALASQARSEALALPAYGAALFLVALPPGSRLSRLHAPSTWLFALLLVALLAPRLGSFFEPGGGAGDAHGFLPARWALLTQQAPFDPALTPIGLQGLALLGLAFAARASPRRATFLLVALLALGATPLLLFDTEIHRARTQLLGTPLFALFAGAGASALVDLFSTRAARALAATLGVGAIVGGALASRIGFVTFEADQQKEQRFLERAIPKLATLRPRALLAPRRNVGRRWLGAFPWYALRRHGVEVELLDLRDAVEGGDWPEPREGLLFYQGTYCFYGYDDEPPPAPLNPRCAAVHRRYRLEPALVEELDAPPYAHAVYAPRPVPIGFFWIRGRAPGASPP